MIDNFIIKRKDIAGSYILIDSGDCHKLESWSGYIVDRPDPQALWKKKSSIEMWDNCHAKFIENRSGKREERGEWKVYQKAREDHAVSFYKDLKAEFKLSPFKHTGIFPEQYSNWSFIDEKITLQKSKSDKSIKILNLFGYTGCASLVAAYAGADEVVHVDASKSSIKTGMANQKKSNLENKKIRWICEDAFVFLKREIRRGNKYDGIIMDPPSFGRGAKGEVWKLEEKFIDFVEEAKKLLSNNPLFFIVNGYAAGYSHIAYRQNIENLKEKYGGYIESGELVFEDENKRFLPAGITARWSSY